MPLPSGDTSDGGGAFPCGRTTANPSPVDAFGTVRWALVGSWVGAATLPSGWVGPSPYGVELTFGGDGFYTARTLDGSPQLPLYYDRNPEHDRFELVDLHANGDVSGNIYLEFQSAPDELRAIRMNAALTHVHFEYFHGGAGPIVYELDCDARADATPWDMSYTPPPPRDLAVSPDLAF